MLDILSEISIRKIPNDYGLPAIKGASPVPLSKENFHTLESVEGKRIGFVDGGNNAIYLAPSQAIHLVRLYYSIFNNNKKIDYGRFTYILDTQLDVDKDMFFVKIYDIDSSNLFPREIKIGANEIDERDKINAIGAYVRRMGEWLLSSRALEKCDILIRDGSLQTGTTREYEYANLVFKNGKDKTIIGFSKTCSLLTDRGYSLIASISHLSKRNKIKAPWYYHPIAMNITTIKGDMFAVKLHPFSDYVFRVEVYPPRDVEIGLGSLVPISNDPTFIGYPYGLIEADVNARITDGEAKMYSQVIYNHADEFTIMQANSMNAHDIISGVK